MMLITSFWLCRRFVDGHLAVAYLVFLKKMLAVAYASVYVHAQFIDVQYKHGA